MKLCIRICWLVAIAVSGGVIHAQGVSGLLPIDKAYQITADVKTPGVIEVHWKIAPQYYLYRGQMRFISGDGVTLGVAQLPPGTKHYDQYLGEVETYHNSIDASVPYQLAPGVEHLRFSVRYQGCHEVTPKMCYPPHVEQFDLPVSPGALTASASQVYSGKGAARGTSGPSTAVTAADQGDKASGEGARKNSAGLLIVLLLALVGGLILNLMPCVLPILAIKVVGVLEGGESVARRRRHALTYAAGVLWSFATIGVTILALRSAGHALGWGAQLQQPLIIGILVCVMVAVGLSMSGVVQFGASLGNIGKGNASRLGWRGDFSTGVLAVVVSSPCIAPFMGTALAYAFVAPTLYALLVFLALGMGLALPFLLIGFVPGLGRLLPKPGAWMETLKQVLAFPMYLTAVWLVWVLAHQRGADAVGLVLTSVVLLAMALWWHERSRYRGAFARAWVLVLALLALTPLIVVARLHPTSVVVEATNKGGVVRFSPEKLAELRKSNTPVFVDMTADWCINCKINEHAVLGTSAFHGLLQRLGVVYMVGDWTDVNPTISAFLTKFHSPGVPLYVIFPRGGGPGKVLPSVLTMSLVRDAVEAASMQSASTSPSNSMTNLDHATVLAKAGKDEEALRAYIAVINGDPNNLRAHEALLKFEAEARISSDKTYKDIQNILDTQYAKWAQRYPDSTTVLFSAGARLTRNEDPRGKQYILKFLKIDTSKADTQLRARAYTMLADDAQRRGDDAAVKKYWRMAAELAPRYADPDSPRTPYAIQYAMVQGSEAAMMDIVRQHPDSSTGASALLMATAYAPDDAKRIELLERLRRDFPPSTYDAMSIANELYYDYLRVAPAKAAELAHQQALSGHKNSGGPRDWPTMEKQAKAYVATRHWVDSGNAGQALGLLDMLPPANLPGFGSSLLLLKARVLVGAHETAKAYELLLHHQASSPDSATGVALQHTADLLHKTTRQVAADLHSLRYAHAYAAPAFDLAQYGSGKHVSLKNLRGKVVLVSFWFPGCGPCRAELPGLQAVMRHYSPKDVVFLGINGVRDQDAYVLPFMMNKKYSFTPLKSTDMVLKDYGVQGFPSNFLIDRSGRIVYSGFQVDNAYDKDQLLSMIKSLL